MAKPYVRKNRALSMEALVQPSLWYCKQQRYFTEPRQERLFKIKNLVSFNMLGSKIVNKNWNHYFA